MFMYTLTEIGSLIALGRVSRKIDFDLLTLKLHKNAKNTELGISQLIFKILRCGLNY